MQLPVVWWDCGLSHMWEECFLFDFTKLRTPRYATVSSCSNTWLVN
jgi:hypothetical protein